MVDYTLLLMFMVFCLCLTLVALTAINANKDKVANNAIKALGNSLKVVLKALPGSSKKSEEGSKNLTPKSDKDV